MQAATACPSCPDPSRPRATPAPRRRDGASFALIGEQRQQRLLRGPDPDCTFCSYVLRSPTAFGERRLPSSQGSTSCETRNSGCGAALPQFEPISGRYPSQAAFPSQKSGAAPGQPLQSALHASDAPAGSGTRSMRLRSVRLAAGVFRRAAGLQCSSTASTCLQVPRPFTRKSTHPQLNCRRARSRISTGYVTPLGECTSKFEKIGCRSSRLTIRAAPPGRAGGGG